MAQADLLLPQWASIDPDRQKFILQQLTRYFLSPLLSVDALVPVSVDYFGQTLNTFDTLIGGAVVTVCARSLASATRRRSRGFSDEGIVGSTP